MAPAPNPDLRNPRAHQAILDAALSLTISNGYPRLTIDAIAAAAGVGRQTIYRWWPTKAAVVLEALNARIGPAIDFPDTGDIAADLATQSNAMIGLLEGELGAVYRALLAEAQSDPALAADIREGIIEPRIQRCRDRLDAAVAARQLRDDIPTRTIVELIYAPLYYRFLLGTDALAPEETAQRITATLTGLAHRA